MAKNFLRDFGRTFYSPKSLYEDIAGGHSSDSWICVFIYCLVYVLGSLWLYMKGFTPFVAPWITLPDDIYYLVQAFYIIPLVFLMWILGTGVLHLVSQSFGGTVDLTNYSL